MVGQLETRQEVDSTRAPTCPVSSVHMVENTGARAALHLAVLDPCHKALHYMWPLALKAN